MDQVYVIRHKVLVEGFSIRAVARQMRVSRNTVRKYLEISQPERRKTKSRKKPVTDKVAPRIEEILEEWWKLRTTPKQRVTGTRIHRKLVEEECRVCITTVREYLREKKRKCMDVYIPLVYRPGDCAQVDFFEITVEEDGLNDYSESVLKQVC